MWDYDYEFMDFDKMEINEIKKKLEDSKILDSQGNIHEGTISNGYWQLTVCSDNNGKQYIESRELDDDFRIQRVSMNNLPNSPMINWAKPFIEFLEPKLNK